MENHKILSFLVTFICLHLQQDLDSILFQDGLFSLFMSFYSSQHSIHYEVDIKLNMLFFFFFFFLGIHLQHMEVPRLGVKLDLQLLAFTTATATPDPSRFCDLHCSLRQCQVPNPLSEGRDRTYILTDTSPVLNLMNHNGYMTEDNVRKRICIHMHDWVTLLCSRN